MLEQQHRERMAAIEKGIDLPPTRPDADGLEPKPSEPDPGSHVCASA